MAIQSPTMEETGAALVAAIAADITLAGASEILAVLPTDPAVTIPLTASEKDAGEYKHVKFGGRDTIPDGLSIMVVPQPFSPEWDSAPRGVFLRYAFHIEIYWKNQAAAVLTDSPGLLHRMLVNVAEALMKVIGPEGLLNDGGAWDVTGSGDFLLNPFIGMAVPSAMIPNEKRHELVWYSILVWSGEKYYAV